MFAFVLASSSRVLSSSNASSSSSSSSSTGGGGLKSFCASSSFHPSFPSRPRCVSSSLYKVGPQRSVLTHNNTLSLPLLPPKGDGDDIILLQTDDKTSEKCPNCCSFFFFFFVLIYKSVSFGPFFFSSPRLYYCKS